MVRKQTKKQLAKKNQPPKKGQKQLIKKFEIKLKFNLRKTLTWLLIGFLIFSFIFSFRTPVSQGEKSLAEVLKDIKAEKVEQVLIEGDTFMVEYKDGEVYNFR